jgi:transmembrane sensor
MHLVENGTPVNKIILLMEDEEERLSIDSNEYITRSDTKQLNQDLASAWDSFYSENSIIPSNSRRIYSNIKRNVHPPRAVLLSFKNFNFQSVAALLLFLGLSYAFYLFFTLPKLNKTDSIGLVIHTTLNGETRRVVLPDGSIAWLNTSSSLSYYPLFKTRDVSVEGEVYFEVKKVPNKPFTVSAKQLTIDVIGTEFTVISYLGEAQTIAVRNGIVKATDSLKNETTLTINNTLTIDAIKGYSKVSITDNSNINSWTNGILVFDNRNFEEVSKILERQFGKKIIFKNDILKKCKLSGEHSSDSLDDILRTIQYVLGCDIQHTKDSIIINGNSCQTL